MTGIDPERLRRRRNWAAEQLGVAAGAPAAEVRSAWLRLLEEDDFVPSSESRWALATLLDRQGATRADEAAAAAEEERLRDAVETFAAKFWELPVEQRRQRWQELLTQIAFAPALQARLRLLEGGLDSIPMPRDPEENARVVELGKWVREQFVLRPAERARARQELMRWMGGEREAWQEACGRLRLAWPALAALGADLLSEVEQSQPPHFPPLRPDRPTPGEKTVAGGAGIPSWLYGVLAALAILVRVGVSSFRDSTSSPAPPSFVRPEMPPIPLLVDPQENPELTEPLRGPASRDQMDLQQFLDKVRERRRAAEQEIPDGEDEKKDRPRP